MATTPGPLTPTGKVQNILQIIDGVLKALSIVPAVGAPAGLADALLNILRGGLAAYQAEVGRPLDLTLIPLETPVP